MPLSRRGLIAGSAASFALAACHGRSDAAVLNVGNQRGGTKSLMLAAGVLDGAPYRIEWSEFPAAQNLVEAIGSGAVDVGLMADAPFQFAYQGGSPICAIGAMIATATTPGALGILVRHDSPARGLDDLLGRKVATTRGGIGHYQILRALLANGHRADAVEITFLSPSDSQAALQSGAVDAWSTWAPYTIAAMQGGARLLINGRDYASGAAFDVAHVGAVRTKRALLTDFLARESRAMDWASTHKDAFAGVLSRETGLPPAVATGTVNCATRVRAPIDPALIAAQQVVLDTFRASGDIKAARPLDQAFVALA